MHANPRPLHCSARLFGKHKPSYDLASFVKIQKVRLEWFFDDAAIFAADIKRTSGLARRDNASKRVANEMSRRVVFERVAGRQSALLNK